MNLGEFYRKTPETSHRYYKILVENYGIQVEPPSKDFVDTLNGSALTIEGKLEILSETLGEDVVVKNTPTKTLIYRGVTPQMDALVRVHRRTYQDDVFYDVHLEALEGYFDKAKVKKLGGDLWVELDKALIEAINAMQGNGLAFMPENVPRTSKSNAQIISL